MSDSTRNRRFIGVAATALAVALGGAAPVRMAQNEPAEKSPTPEQPLLDPSKGPLSKQLGETGGVIKPPKKIDPEIQREPPATGTTPVIPPPGTPGGDPRFEPK